MEPTYAGGVSTQPPSIDIAGRTRKVVEFHRDPEQPGRPLMLLLGGAALALVCLVLIGALAFRTFYEHRVGENQGYFGISLLFCFYVLGVFLFCYAYELYDLPKALRLTIIASLVSLVFLALVIVSLSTLAKMKDGVVAAAGQSEAVRSNPVASTIVSYMDGGTSAAEAEAAEARRRRGGFEDFITPEARPFYVTCLGCNEVFTPVPPDAKCPYCGRAALSS